MPKPPFQVKNGIPQFASTRGAPPPVKTEFRRIIGAAPADKLNKRATDGVLLALCTDFAGKSHNSQSTMALGIYENGSENVVMIALQEGAKANPAAIGALVANPNYAAYDVRLVPPGLVPPAPGLHAEMMIVRALMLLGLLEAVNIANSAAGIKLRIACPEKNVCPDCSGYLRKHGIPHYPTDCGSASPNWVNPRTGACFRATKREVTYYNKLSAAPFGNPVDSGAGNLGPIGRVG